MSLKAIPLLVLALILYNALVIFSGADPANVLGREIFQLTMASGGVWHFLVSDLLIMLAVILLGVEVVKATYTRGSGLADQALSMIVFIIFIVEFLLISKAATSTFFIMTLLSLVDIIGGSIIGIRTARRDIGFGGNSDS